MCRFRSSWISENYESIFDEYLPFVIHSLSQVFLIILPIHHLPLPGKNYFQFYYRQYHKAVRWYLTVTDIYLIHILSFQVRFGQMYVITLARIMQLFGSSEQIKSITLQLGPKTYTVNDNHHHDVLL